ncbi:MAG: glutathione S-transferase family protein [Pseudomonadales bacterium]|jgi:glutathione S-transferase|nr:glutathione S-transferase family protein [Pseudomonadales bacterium]|tara:strand:+ start:2527 stop:3111 length:585 start_codon:yes stop_codon:yes gene_type:complete
MADSDNCYKARLVLHQLDIDYPHIPTDILKGESRTPGSLKLNPNGRVPLLICPDGRPLAESNAMLLYLADDSPLVPEDPYERALVLQWLFFEQYSHEPFIATNRYWIHIAGQAKEQAELLTPNHPKDMAALDVMDTHLSSQSFFAAGCYTIAGIALYAYTHAAHEGGYDLGEFPNMSRWLDDVRMQARHIPITA